MASVFRKDDWIWVEHAEEAWVPAKIVDEDGDDLKCEGVDGAKYTVKKSSNAPRAHPSCVEAVPNMVDLEELAEGSILHNLKLRYQDDHIYTYIANVVVSINPYKMLPIYTPATIAEYRRALAARQEMPPHVYTLADNAYKSLTIDQLNQAVIVSGESGAGKTEATKVVLQYLADVSGKGDAIEQQILEANPIIEAFGNAQTVRNNNSSRFGKWIEILFNGSYQIYGSRITNYLLEKSRVVYLAKGERNFHVFYNLCEGASAKEKKEWRLLPTKEFRFCNQGQMLKNKDMNDKNNFKKVRQSMGVLKFSKDEQSQVFRSLAAVLHLGNMTFEEGDKNDSSRVTSADRLGDAAHLLGVDEAALDAALTTRTIKVMKDTLQKPRTVTDARACREALSKAIYNNMFNWLILRINETMYKEESKHLVIGVLDIFGFEIFEPNFFEQFCINYANEKLQQHFTHYVFTMAQQEYSDEGISVEHVKYVDNQPCLDLVEKPRTGILAMIVEEIRLPRGSDENLVGRMHQAHERHAHYEAPKGRALQFTVKHYAGNVRYEVEGFLEKNKDQLHDDLTALMQGSGNPIMSQLFAPAKEPEDEAPSSRRGGGRGGGKGKKITALATVFKQQLEALMKTLRSTEPHFIRCIKPNTKKSSDNFNSHLVLEQLNYLGLEAVINIRRAGFPVRKKFADFWQRYSMLQDLGGDKEKGDAEDKGEGTAENITKLLQFLAIDETGYAIGTTKAFLKGAVQQRLEELRETMIAKLIVMLQARVRGKQERRRYLIRLAAQKALIACTAETMAAADALQGDTPEQQQTEVEGLEALRAKLAECVEEAEDMEVSTVAIAEGRAMLTRAEALESARRALVAAEASKDTGLLETALEGAKGAGLPAGYLAVATQLLADLLAQREMMRVAVEARDLPGLEAALARAEELGVHSEELLPGLGDALRLLERLKQEVAMIKAIDEAMAERTLAAVKAVRVKAACMQPPLSTHHPEVVSKLKALEERLVQEQQAREALTAAMQSKVPKRTKVVELGDALAAAVALDLAGEEGTQQALAMKEKLEAEIAREDLVEATRDGLQQALDAKDSEALGKALAKAAEVQATAEECAEMAALIASAEDVVKWLAQLAVLRAELECALATEEDFTSGAKSPDDCLIVVLEAVVHGEEARSAPALLAAEKEEVFALVRRAEQLKETLDAAIARAKLVAELHEQLQQSLAELRPAQRECSALRVALTNATAAEVTEKEHEGMAALCEQASKAVARVERCNEARSAVQAAVAAKDGDEGASEDDAEKARVAALTAALDQARELQLHEAGEEGDEGLLQGADALLAELQSRIEAKAQLQAALDSEVAREELLPLLDAALARAAKDNLESHALTQAVRAKQEALLADIAREKAQGEAAEALKAALAANEYSALVKALSAAQGVEVPDAELLQRASDAVDSLRATRALGDSLAAAVESRDAALLTDALGEAEAAGYKGLPQEQVDSARALLATVQKEQVARAALQEAAAELRRALDTGVLEVLQGARKGLAEALVQTAALGLGKDGDEGADAEARSEASELDSRADAQEKQLLAGQEAREALQAAVAAGAVEANFDPLSAALERVRELGLDDCQQLVLQAGQLQERVTLERNVLAELRAASEAAQTGALDKALSRAVQAGLAEHPEAVSARALADALGKSGDAKVQLEAALATKNEALLHKALEQARESALHETEEGRALVKAGEEALAQVQAHATARKALAEALASAAAESLEPGLVGAQTAHGVLSAAASRAEELKLNAVGDGARLLEARERLAGLGRAVQVVRALQAAAQNQDDEALATALAECAATDGARGVAGEEVVASAQKQLETLRAEKELRASQDSAKREQEKREAALAESLSAAVASGDAQVIDAALQAAEAAGLRDGEQVQQARRRKASLDQAQLAIERANTQTEIDASILYAEKLGVDAGAVDKAAARRSSVAQQQHLKTVLQQAMDSKDEGLLRNALDRCEQQQGKPDAAVDAELMQGARDQLRRAESARRLREQDLVSDARLHSPPGSPSVARQSLSRHSPKHQQQQQTKGKGGSDEQKQQADDGWTVEAEFDPAPYRDDAFQLHLASVLRAPDEYARGKLFQKKKLKLSMLRHVTNVIPTSLTQMDNMTSKMAIELFKSVQGFMCDRSYQYLESVAVEIMEKGMQYKPLRNEILAQIMKQTTENPNPDSRDEGWLLFCLCVETFAPTPEFVPFVYHFLLRHAEDPRADPQVAEYANFCVNTMRRTLAAENPVRPPSVQMVTQFRDKAMTPVPVTVTFPDGTHLKMPLDPWTTSQHHVKQLAEWIGLRDVEGIAIFETDRAGGDSYLGPYECALDREDAMEGLSRLVMRKRLFQPPLVPSGDAVATSLVYHQLVVALCDRHHVVPHDALVRLVAMHRVIVEGGQLKPIGNIDEARMKFVREISPALVGKKAKEFEDAVQAEMDTLRAQETTPSPEDWLKDISQYELCAAQVFICSKEEQGKRTNQTIAINWNGLAVLDMEMQVTGQHTHKELVGFTFDDEHVMIKIVVNAGLTATYKLATEEGAQICGLLQDYAEAALRRA